MPGTHSALAATDFVSHYAATSMYEDFAETYAMYVHVVLQWQPWRMAVHDDSGAIVQALVNPILEDRRRAKKRYLDKLFE